MNYPPTSAAARMLALEFAEQVFGETPAPGERKRAARFVRNETAKIINAARMAVRRRLPRRARTRSRHISVSARRTTASTSDEPHPAEPYSSQLVRYAA